MVPHVQGVCLRSEKCCLIKDICRKTDLSRRSRTWKTLLLYQKCTLRFPGGCGDSRKHNSLTLLFCMVYKCPLLMFFLEKLSLGFFWIWKRSYMYPQPFVPLVLSRVPTFRERRVTADELFSTRTFPKAFVFIWFKENKYSQETWLLTPHFHLGKKQTKEKPSSA